MIEVWLCKFKFECPKAWDSLTHTDNERVRFCPHCNKNVYFCHSASDLHTAAMQDFCVAIEIRSPETGELTTSMGIPRKPNRTKKIKKAEKN